MYRWTISIINNLTLLTQNDLHRCCEYFVPASLKVQRKCWGNRGNCCSVSDDHYCTGAALTVVAQGGHHDVGSNKVKKRR
ncbi:hypothetical protein GBAR_LOCUS16348, partial [Geodia barretti]